MKCDLKAVIPNGNTESRLEDVTYYALEGLT